ncbi:MAG: PH domain-containing protein [Cryobacterium sp.]|uniref:PH domain-containing protein n=1 Tax=Cryobacterium sp. TaxID=1926290 RepID=UPI0022A43404|nr:PH domain-containing protein [Cryobacterium sp.]MCY7405302.1 PH domain-containing protein [Cryobacterium sp.]
MPHSPDPDQSSPSSAAPVVFFSRFNRIVAATFWMLCALSVLSLFLLPSGTQLYYLVGLAFIALFVWEVLWAPLVRVSDDAVTLANPLRTVVIPWAALINVDTKFALTLFTPGRKFAAFAAPAPGRNLIHASNNQIADPVPFMTGQPRPGDLLSSESGEAAHLVRSRWDRLLAANLIEAGVAEQTPILVRWHWGRGAILVFLGAASIAAVVLA